MSIAGIFKEVTTIMVSAWVFGDELTPLNILGVGITFIGGSFSTTSYFPVLFPQALLTMILMPYTQVLASSRITNTRKRSIRLYRSTHMGTHCHKKRRRRFYRLLCDLISPLRRASLAVM